MTSNARTPTLAHPPPAAAAAVVQPLTPDFPRLGMTVRRLLRVIDSRSGGRRALNGLTTEEVKDVVFAPLTAATQLSLCEQLQAEGDVGVNVAAWFVSHAWMSEFVELLEALEHFFADTPQGLDTCIWLDLVSTSQHGVFNRPPQWWAATFQTAIQSMGNMVMVISPWDKPVTLTRAWCILELYACCCNSACRFEVALSNNQRQLLEVQCLDSADSFNSFLANVNTESSQCSRESDRQSIFSAVRASVGFAALDTIIRRTLSAWMLRMLHERGVECDIENLPINSAMWLKALGTQHLNLGMNEDSVRVLEEAVGLLK